MDKELKRQTFHAMLGIVVLLMLLHYGRGFTIAVVFCVVMIGMLLMNLRLRGWKLGFIRWFEEQFERDRTPFPGWGSACYAAGVLMLLTFLSGPAEISAAVFILAIGDAFSTIIGRYGTRHLPYNKNKTVEGSVVFFLSSLPAYYFLGPLVIPLAAVATLAETLPNLEDNLTIPTACVLLLLFA